MFRWVVFAAVLPLSSFAETHQEPGNCPNGKQHTRATLRHIESGGIGYEEGYTTLEAFLAPDPSLWKVTPFLDARGHVFDNGKWAANVGVGLRTLWGNRAYGINTYYDYRNTRRFHSNQLGVGLETLGKRFDFRINGYLPLGAKISNPYDTTFKTFSGNELLLSQKFQSAMKGSDAECGVHFGKSKSFDFYTAAGPYYFIGEKAPATWGGKARIAATFKDIFTLEISDSYDRTFHNKFQGQISLSFSFGPKSTGHTCNNDRMLQPVARQEIIVIDKIRKNTVAIDPATGRPYFFVFVDNTSSSNGTYESPYHSFTQAQDNSSPNDIIYVFPGDGTTTGMDSGIALKANQKFWGSGISHPLQTTQGTISIPGHSSSSPTITNTNIHTEGNAITLATHNAISGFTMTSANNDAIYGTDPQSLEVSSCTFDGTQLFTIEATFSDNASISLTNNQFLNNTNGISLTLNGTSTLDCSNNTFNNQSSPFEFPLLITAANNAFTANIENNSFNNNETGSIFFALTNVQKANINILNNTMTNSRSGTRETLGSNIVIYPNDTINNCSIVLNDNTVSGNLQNSFYVHTTGGFTTLNITASENTMSDNGGGALIFGSECSHFTFNATNNTLSNLNNNGIGMVGGTSFQTANITINNNTISAIGGSQSAIDIAQGSSTLNLTVKDNTINTCDGSGLVCYANSGEFTNMTATITGNVMSNCQNTGESNAASGISLDTYLNLTSTIANNTLSDNATPGVAVGVNTSGTPTVCLTLTNNSSDTDPGYSLTNPDGGTFNLSPCDVMSINSGTISPSDTIDYVSSCSNPTPCP